MRKIISLKMLFAQYLATLILFLIIGVAIPVLFLTFCVNSGFLLPANTNEVMLQKAQAEITMARVFSEDLVPQEIKYALLDKSLTLLQTNMDDTNADKAVQFAKGQYQNLMFSDRFMLITRDNDYVVLKYSLHSSYASPKLNSFLPQPEILCLLLIGLNVVSFCILVTLLFAKKITRQIDPLQEAAGQISNQNLDFDVGHSYIKELDTVLLSLKDMKEELKKSLEKQWKEEQEQREQIAALAHDLKTPLTVLYGNLDLLYETQLSTEQKQYTETLLEHTGHMEQSIKALIEQSRAASGYSLHITSVNPINFLEQLQKKTVALTSLKNIQVEVSFHDLPEFMECDAILFERAALNIISNAVDFTPEQGTIRMEAKQTHNDIVLTVTDSGQGFSKESLAQGKKRFYMDDSSRSSRYHYGMGLTIAEHIVRQHGGSLILANGMGSLQGAHVTLSIPICPSKA